MVSFGNGTPFFFFFLINFIFSAAKDTSTGEQVAIKKASIYRFIHVYI